MSSPEDEENFPAPAVVTAFSILDLLVKRSGPTRLAEVISELKIPKTSAMRVLQTLAQLDVVRRDSESGAYVLGPHLLNYTYAPRKTEMTLVQEFNVVAEQFRRDYNETVQLAVLGGTDVTFIAKVDSSHPVRLVTHVGRQLPAHATAVGKAILAHEAPAAVQKVLDAGLIKAGPNTITKVGAFLEELDAVRRNGYATEREESTPNLSCVSAPIFDATGKVVAGFTVCVPVVEIPKQRRTTLIAAVRRAAQSLTEAIGGDLTDSLDGMTA
ncbi:MAG: IclR family transcriptional regulator [Acidobacteria bacterium]|nr:IclR family transcriptional regulator [Acidobacteriota bacterium]